MDNNDLAAQRLFDLLERNANTLTLLLPPDEVAEMQRLSEQAVREVQKATVALSSVYDAVGCAGELSGDEFRAMREVAEALREVGIDAPDLA